MTRGPSSYPQPEPGTDPAGSESMLRACLANV